MKIIEKAIRMGTKRHFLLYPSSFRGAACTLGGALISTIIELLKIEENIFVPKKLLVQILQKKLRNCTILQFCDFECFLFG